LKYNNLAIEIWNKYNSDAINVYFRKSLGMSNDYPSIDGGVATSSGGIKKDKPCL
jgi:hypothetical protein